MSAGSDSTGLAPLAPADVAQAIALIQTAYAPDASSDPAQIESLQSALLAMQRTPAAWGLIIPLLGHDDLNVQFFGALTAQAKIARGELETLSPEDQLALRDILFALVGVPRSRVVQMKLFGAVTALALRLVPGRPSRWEGWVQATVQTLVASGSATPQIHHFLACAAEDIVAADLLPQPKIELYESLRSAAPLVLQSIATVLAHPPSPRDDPDSLNAALTCLLAWFPTRLIPDVELASLVPPLIALLDTGGISSYTLIELLSHPPPTWTPAILIEPLLSWAARTFPNHYSPEEQNPYYPASVPPLAERRVLRPHTQLLVALAEAAVEWVAAHLVDPSVASSAHTSTAPPRAALSQHMLRIMLALTAMDAGGAPLSAEGEELTGGYEDDDEDEGEESTATASLGFWYLLQEALWEVPVSMLDVFAAAVSADDHDHDDGAEVAKVSAAERARTAHAQAAYVALVRILRGKVVCGRDWDRDHLDYFKVYRREAADTLVNAYYVLRTDLLEYYVADASARLDAGEPWENIEATLHCLCAVHEAVDLDSIGRMVALARLFGAEVWGRLPARSAPPIARLRRTALRLIGTYAAYFTIRPPDELLLPLQYVIGALADSDRRICHQATLALRSLCDANRSALAGRISAFAEVYAGLGGVPDSEKGKVLQSIASVIQALPPAEAIAPVEAMVRPILQQLRDAFGVAETHPDTARSTAILQLEILAGIAKGLTRITVLFDDEDGSQTEADAALAARKDPRIDALRAAIFDCIAQMAELWSADAEVGQALSELFKSITALPADVTLVTLPAQPLLGVVCRAAGRRLNAVWLALATILIAQLNPPPLFLTLRSGPSEEAEACVRNSAGQIVSAGLHLLGAPGGMLENPDIVQEFFACMDRVAQDFTSAFCALPDGAFDALMQCAISALSLQERYSLVASCTFLGTLVHRTALFASISPELLKQLQAHMIRTHGHAMMRAVLCGFAGAAPRSAMNNLLELLGALVSRWDEQVVGEALAGPGQKAPGGARAWVREIVFAGDFYPSHAGSEAKERFVKAVVSSRSVKKTKEAANQFSTIARGLQGSTFGYSAVSAM
ncbi:armadillo-type protein [Mycena pura]|uniref:Armadillo-type protein n=1 Tax=Mycena pura TaxID=153505 RepID=A0AAD6VUY0_9AGAR|nr:armadillo-type protein [Mycena pura]